MGKPDIKCLFTNKIADEHLCREFMSLFMVFNSYVGSISSSHKNAFILDGMADMSNLPSISVESCKTL